jgi:hypothetical protein
MSNPYGDYNRGADIYGNYQQNGIVGGSNTSLNQFGGSLKQEEEMAQAIKKALTPEDAAPKQKHIRSIILYTWDSKGSGYLFDALKSYPMVFTINLDVKRSYLV